MSGKPAKNSQDPKKAKAGAEKTEAPDTAPKASKEKKAAADPKPQVVQVQASSCWLESSQKSYAPGDTVQLVAHLNLRRKFTSVFAVIEGLIKVKVYKTEGCFATKKMVFEGFEYLVNGATPGLYSVPVRFTLPDDLPNSFEYAHLRNEMSIEYSVKVAADDEILVMSKLVVYRPNTAVSTYPKSVLEKKSFRSSWYSFRDSVVAFNMDISGNTYNYGEHAVFSVKSSSRDLKTKIKQIYGALFMIILGKGPLAGFQLIVPRNETKSSTEEYPLNFDVTITPSFIEQPTECELFKVDYGVGILVDGTGMYGLQPILIPGALSVPNSDYYSDYNEYFSNEVEVQLKLGSKRN